MTIRIGIAGYGNLGKSAEKIVNLQEDMELKALFTRRPNDVEASCPVYDLREAEKFRDDIDVLLLCLGSAKDIPELAPKLAEHFNIVDVYDNHHDMLAHCKRLDDIAKTHDKVAVVAAGWDPGLFSLNRVLASALFPESEQYTFWGEGVSQGHSDAIRKVEGVKMGVQYTVPNPEALQAVTEGHGKDFASNARHLRECYVVCDVDDQERIEDTICNMPDYFKDYETTVHFIGEDEFLRDHQAMPHGGKIMTLGRLGDSEHLVEFHLSLKSNPDFTAAVQIAYARAAHHLADNHQYGAKTILDIPISYISPLSFEEMIHMV